LMAMLLSIPLLPAQDGGIEATTVISLPVDSVTIYPDGLVAVRRTGSMELTEGQHDFVVDVPSSASMDTVLFLVTNASVERVIYDKPPIYTLNVLEGGRQRFSLSYLMEDAAAWSPSYSLHLLESSMVVSAMAVVANDFDENLEDVLLKLVSGPPQEREVGLRYALAEAAPEPAYYDSAPKAAAPYIPGAGGTSGQQETLFVFQIENRTDLEMRKPVGLPLFEKIVPLDRMLIWDASARPEGPAKEEIRANNSMDVPWPAGDAMLYREGDYLSGLQVPYTQVGSNASLDLGATADVSVSKKLLDYNISEEVREAGWNSSQAFKVTIENWTYRLELDSAADKVLQVEVSDSRPMKSELIDVSRPPDETTATGLKWELSLDPRSKQLIEYTYRVVKTEAWGG